MAHKTRFDGGCPGPINPDTPLHYALRKVAEKIARELIDRARQNKELTSDAPINTPMDAFEKTIGGLGRCFK
jgi:hypothetical protein